MGLCMRSAGVLLLSMLCGVGSVEAQKPTGLRGDPAAFSKLIDKHQKGIVAFRQVCYLGRPVIHLYVDVNMIVGVPWRNQAVRPDPLQVGGQVARPGRADHSR